MDTLGRHVILDLWNCNREHLNKIEFIKTLFVEAALKAGADIKEVCFHKFSPQGVSGVVIIAESHLTIHSFPEHGYASIDIYTCGEKVDPNISADHIAENLQAKKIEKIELPRGNGKLLAKSYETIQ